MTKLYNDFLQQTPNPTDMQCSYLTIIPKPDKDPFSCASYRPIALLISDLKMFTKIPSIHLNVILPSVIHKGQVGFVPLCQVGDNTRKVIDLINMANRDNTESMILSLGAEKAIWGFGDLSCKRYNIFTLTHHPR